MLPLSLCGPGQLAASPFCPPHLPVLGGPELGGQGLHLLLQVPDPEPPTQDITSHPPEGRTRQLMSLLYDQPTRMHVLWVSMPVCLPACLALCCPPPPAPHLSCPSLPLLESDRCSACSLHHPTTGCQIARKAATMITTQQCHAEAGAPDGSHTRTALDPHHQVPFSCKFFIRCRTLSLTSAAAPRACRSPCPSLRPASALTAAPRLPPRLPPSAPRCSLTTTQTDRYVNKPVHARYSISYIHNHLVTHILLPRLE